MASPTYAVFGVVEEAQGPERLVRQALNGNKLAIARILTMLEEDPYRVPEVVRRLWVREPRSHVVGFTGSAGVGKSTLISAVASRLAKEGLKVAVLAIDPSSPFTGGALLGDRVRMRRLTGTVFIRSMSTVEEESLPWKALLAIEALEGLGYDYVIVETPGVGQFNVRVMKAVDTVVVVLMPGAGDEIQALKAGLMEIGDIYVVNKADLPEAQLTSAQVNFVLKDVVRMGWRPEILLTSPILGKGIKELITAIKKHWEFIKKHGIQSEKRRTRRELEVELLIIEALKRMIKQAMESDNQLRKAYERAVNGEIDTITASTIITSKLLRDRGNANNPPQPK